MHSTGAVFVTIDNLPRGVRYLRENTFLIGLIPGPHEPNTDQLNELLAPLSDDIRILYKGEKYAVHSFSEPLDVYGTLPFIACDTPARLKAGGYTSQNSENDLCVVCNKPFPSLVDPECFDRESKYLLILCSRGLTYFLVTISI